MATKITFEEYNNRSSEYTKKALDELNDVIRKTPLQPRKKKHYDSSSDEDLFDQFSPEDDSEDQLIGRSKAHKCGAAKSAGALKRSKTSTFVDVDTYVLRIEKLMRHNHMLKSRISRIQKEFDATDAKLHQCRLDLSNASVDLERSKEVILQMTSTNKNLEAAKQFYIRLLLFAKWSFYVYIVAHVFGYFMY